MSKFYVIGTPIGNLEDITYRAVRVLGEVDLVLCEDTRVTKNLLSKYNISTPTLSYPSDNQATETKFEKILALIEEGKTLALVSDAGTPTISDPGSVLIAKIRARFPEMSIEPIPGPSALITALSASGLAASTFTFLGFLPHKKGRETLFKEMAESERVIIFYESPHRLIKTLESLNKFCPQKRITLARELTKIFEQIINGQASELLVYFDKHPDKIRGEFVIILADK